MTVINNIICKKDNIGLNILHAQVSINLTKRFGAFQLHSFQKMKNQQAFFSGKHVSIKFHII